MHAPSEHPHGSPRLVLRFAIYAGAAVLLAVAGALVLSRFNASQRAESDLTDDAHYVADELGGTTSSAWGSKVASPTTSRPSQRARRGHDGADLPGRLPKR